METEYIIKGEAIERISKRTCKGKGKNYTAGYMDGLETANRVLSAMEAREDLREHTVLTRDGGEGRVCLLQWGMYVVYGDQMLIGTCHRCNHENILDARFCSFCGAKVDSWRDKGE